MSAAGELGLGRSRGVSNEDVAGALERVSDLLATQRANPFRVKAYRSAAKRVRALDEPVWTILKREGTEGLEELPDIGPRLAKAIDGLLRTGRLPILARLEGEICPEALFKTVPGIGDTMANRIHRVLGIETLEDLEVAAHDGRLESVPGFGHRRVQAVRETLASMLGRASRLRSLASRPTAEPAQWRRTQQRSASPTEPLSVAELLAIDREYRELAARDALVRIVPRRFNPERERWLPLLHSSVGASDITAMFSNTALAHQLGRTHDWVVIYVDEHGVEERHTVVTENRGDLSGLRVVRGREAECADYYARLKDGRMPPRAAPDEPFLPGLEAAEVG